MSIALAKDGSAAVMVCPSPSGRRIGSTGSPPDTVQTADAGSGVKSNAPPGRPRSADRRLGEVAGSGVLQAAPNRVVTSRNPRCGADRPTRDIWFLRAL